MFRESGTSFDVSAFLESKRLDDVLGLRGLGELDKLESFLAVLDPQGGVLSSGREKGISRSGTVAGISDPAGAFFAVGTGTQLDKSSFPRVKEMPSIFCT